MTAGKPTPAWAQALIDEWKSLRRQIRMDPLRSLSYSGSQWFRVGGVGAGGWCLKRHEVQNEIEGMRQRIAREQAQREAEARETEERAYWAARGIQTGRVMAPELYF